MNIKVVNRVLSIILICQIAFILVVGIYIEFLTFDRMDLQRKTILTYIEENRFVGMTVEECKDVLGEPLYENETMMCFDGGSECNTDFFSEIYEEYELRVYFDENGKAYSTSERCTLSVMY